MLVPMRAILEAADKYHYGQAAFNMNSVGQVQAAIRIHELLDSAAILQGAEASNAYLGGAADFMHGSLEESLTDRQEAELCGRAAVDAATNGENGKMVALRRVPGEEYRCETFLADIADVMMTEHKLPDRFINAKGNGVTEEFKAWCRPLLGPPLPRLIDLRSEYRP